MERVSVVHLCCFFDEICYGTIGGSLYSTILHFFCCLLLDKSFLSDS